MQLPCALGNVSASGLLLPRSNTSLSTFACIAADSSRDSPIIWSLDWSAMELQMLRACNSVPFCSQHQSHPAVHTTRSRLPGNAARYSPAHRSRHRGHVVIAAAENGDKPDQPAAQEQDASAAPKPRGKRKSKKRSTAGKTVSLTLRRSQEEAEEVAEAFTLDDFNPVAIGKRSRQVQWANSGCPRMRSLHGRCSGVKPR